MAKQKEVEVVKAAAPKMDKDKKAAVLKALASVQESFGEDVAFYGNDSKTLDIESIPTGSLGLDNAIGVGGFPRGRISEIFGAEASGKTLICLSTIGQCQRMGGQAVFIDVEQSITKEWCKSLGVDFDNLIIVQPNSGEEALKVLQKFVETNAVDLVVLDSIAALVPKSVIDGEIGDITVAAQARLMSQAISKLTPIISKTKVAALFINQTRVNIGGYGNPEVTPGGKAMKFYASVRLRVGKVNSSEIKDPVTGDQIGHRMKVNVVKNKVASPFRIAEFDLIYTKGIQQKSEVSELAMIKGIVSNPKGRTYTYKNYTWTSKKDYDQAVKDDQVLCDLLMADVKKALADKAPNAVVGEVEEIEEVNGTLVNKKTGEVIEVDGKE
jgi:recombination protein RecA